MNKLLIESFVKFGSTNLYKSVPYEIYLRRAKLGIVLKNPHILALPQICQGNYATCDLLFIIKFYCGTI